MPSVLRTLTFARNVHTCNCVTFAFVGSRYTIVSDRAFSFCTSASYAITPLALEILNDDVLQFTEVGITIGEVLLPYNLSGFPTLRSITFNPDGALT
jgi:hypothetical protein